MVLNAYPFLAEIDRVDANALVVEGWVHDYAIHTAVEEFKSGTYSHIFTTGGPVEGSGHYTSYYNTAASVGADRLMAAGVSKELLQAVPSYVNNRDRTYCSAIALRDWLRKHNLRVRAINLVTENVHARRSRLLFEKAFGKDVKVGVVAAVNPDYDPKHWWHWSEGVRDVTSEAIAYIYARFFFYPNENGT